MARYKVTYTVYKGPSGKTLFLPTMARAVGSCLLYFGIFFLFALLMNVVQGRTAMMQVVAIFAVIGVVGIVLGLFIRKWAENKAKDTYVKQLAEMDEKP